MTRPKIKRLEKHEIKTVEERDLELLGKALDRFPKGSTPKSQPIKPKALKKARAKLPLELVKEGSSSLKNVRRYLVKFTGLADLEQLFLQVPLDFGDGRRGRICGVEQGVGVEKFDVGDTVMVALWNDGSL